MSKKPKKCYFDIICIFFLILQLQPISYEEMTNNKILLIEKTRHSYHTKNAFLTTEANDIRKI